MPSFSPHCAPTDAQAHEAVIKLRDNLRSEQHIVLEFAITIFRDVFKPAQVRHGSQLGATCKAECYRLYATDLFATDQMNRPATLGRSTDSRLLCLSSCKHRSILPALHGAHHMPRIARGTRSQLQPYGTTSYSASIPPPPFIIQWQMAALLVKCYPAVPDALGIASALAVDLGEPDLPHARQLTMQLGGYLGE